jgi:hypothetical protein
LSRAFTVAGYEETGRLLLEELEIADKANKLPVELSRGMKQKLAIACGLLHAPQVIFFDEPLTGLDPIGIRRMKDSILKRARDGAAILDQFAPAAFAGGSLLPRADSQRRAQSHRRQPGGSAGALFRGIGRRQFGGRFFRATGETKGEQ